MIAAPTLYPFADRVDNAVAYSAPVAGTASRIGRNRPNRAMIIVVVASKGGADALNVGIDTSRDGVNWVSLGGMGLSNIANNGTYAIVLDRPLLEYVRCNFGEAGTDCTATLTTYYCADRRIDADESGPVTRTYTTTGSLAWCVDRHAESSVSPGATTVYTDAKPVEGRWEAGIFDVTVSGRSAGNVTVTIQWSFDGGTTWVDGDATGSLSANGTTVVGIAKALNEKYRFKIAGASSFNGAVVCALNTASRRDEIPLSV